MKAEDENWRELSEAARSAGDTAPGEEEQEELRHLWERLGELPGPTEEPRPAVSFRDLERFQGLVGAGAREPVAAPPRRLNWTQVAGIAAVVALVGLLGGLGWMQARVARMESHLAQLRTSVVVAALNSDSAADRLDVLIGLAALETPPERLQEAVLLRLEVDRSASVRLAAVRSLGTWAEQPARLDTLEALARSESSPLVRAEILARLRRADPARAARMEAELRSPGSGGTPI